MKTTVNNIASENVTSFVINEDMLNEKKAMKYISKPNMVAAINDICAAIKGLNSLFSPQEYTEANSKKELFDAYHRFYIIYTDLRDAAIEARHREEEKAEREERRRQAEIAKNTAELIKPAQPLKSGLLFTLYRGFLFLFGSLVSLCLLIGFRGFFDLLFAL